MSDYYLKYYEINRSKNQLIRSGNKMDRIGSEYLVIKSNLSGQRGLGIERVREQLDILSRKTLAVGDDLKDVGQFLEYLIHETEAADTEAKKILNRFSLDKGRQFAKILVKLLSYFNKVLIGWLGGYGKQTGMIGVEWASRMLDLGNEEAGKTDLEGVGETFLSWITKNLINSLGGKGTKTDVAGAVKTGFNKTSFFASWISASLVDVVKNFTDQEGTFSEDVGESIVETLLEAGKAAAVVAIVGAIGLTGGAGAVAAAVVGIGVTWALDFASEQIFDNDLGMIENMGDVICNWFSQMAF